MQASHNRSHIRTTALALVAVLTVVFPPATAAADGGGAAVFERLKQLVGTWQGTWQPGDLDTVVTYSLTGNGSAVVEDYLLGGEVTMATIYHMDGDDLMLTHYCSRGNQPRMRLVDRRADGGDDVAEFEFVDVTNWTSGGYSKGLKVAWLDDDRISVAYTGSRTGGSTGVELRRVRDEEEPEVDARANAQEAFVEEARIGFLIPSQCKPKESEKPQPKGSTDAWPAPHTTECALRPVCIESGYGLWVEDRFYRFDEAGQQKALRYFQTSKRTSHHRVRVTGDFRDPSAVRVESIRLTDDVVVDGAAIFEDLKSLVGEWRGTLQPTGKPVVAHYRLAGGGSALVEEIQRLDKDSSMLTVYHLDGCDLRLTHFCSFRNQPRLRATSVNRAQGVFDVGFDFIDVTNLAESGPRYTGRILVSLRGETQLSVTFFGVEEGVPSGSLTADLTRRPSASEFQLEPSAYQ